MIHVQQSLEGSRPDVGAGQGMRGAWLAENGPLAQTLQPKEQEQTQRGQESPGGKGLCGSLMGAGFWWRRFLSTSR